VRRIKNLHTYFTNEEKEILSDLVLPLAMSSALLIASPRKGNLSTAKYIRGIVYLFVYLLIYLLID